MQENRIGRTTDRLTLRAPNGIRTRVTAVKGRCPRPLDDGDDSLRILLAFIPLAKTRYLLERERGFGLLFPLFCFRFADLV